MIRYTLAIASAALLGLALAGTASARVGHLPCPTVAAGQYSSRGIGLDNMPNEMVYEHYSEYRVCGALHMIREGGTRDLSIDCRPGFRLGDTRPERDARHPRWNFYSTFAEWVTWDGIGHFRTRHGQDTGFTAQLHNWNLSDSWRVIMFATCDRIPDYKF